MRPGVKQKPLWKISIATSSEAEEAVTELLQTVVDLPVSSYTDAENRETSVAAYLSKKPAWSHIHPQLLTGMALIRGCGLKVGMGETRLQKVRREDWAESWKRHFKPLEVNARLLVKPSWSKHRARKGQAVVVLDPGLSFGTGQHPTTSFCLRQLASRFRPGQSFLDIGTGSGILAIAAAKLGASRVEALDVDPEAVRIARHNAVRNGVIGQIRISRADLTRLPVRSTRQYDMICANLVSTLLISERNRILSRLKTGCVLVVAGILKPEFADVQCAYETAGLKLIAGRVGNEWRSGAFVSR